MKNLKSTITLIMILLTTLSSFAKKDKPPVIITKQIILNTTIEKAWKILGPEFADAHKWASSIKHSQANDTKSFNGSTCSERGCDVSGIGNIKEKITEYSDTEHVLSYDVYEGMPSMVRHMNNYWKLTDLGNGSVKLEMKMTMKIGGMMGAMMKGMMKKKMSKTADQIIEEFKYYTENGTPHPRVVKANKKK
ncbi:MAG: SRPBCC family protein [Flavobacteriales bacterium]|nr:SRPBCC family protein [Flavobacteriales bacterium]